MVLAIKPRVSHMEGKTSIIELPHSQIFWKPNVSVVLNRSNLQKHCNIEKGWYAVQILCTLDHTQRCSVVIIDSLLRKFSWQAQKITWEAEVWTWVSHIQDKDPINYALSLSLTSSLILSLSSKPTFFDTSFLVFMTTPFCEFSLSISMSFNYFTTGGSRVVV